MDDIKVAVKYPLGHIYHEHMKRSDGYCPNCGGKTVWDNLGDGDYYYGSPSYCTTCDFIWHLCLGHKMDPKDAADSQIMKAIKQRDLATGNFEHISYPKLKALKLEQNEELLSIARGTK